MLLQTSAITKLIVNSNQINDEIFPRSILAQILILTRMRQGNTLVYVFTVSMSLSIVKCQLNYMTHICIQILLHYEMVQECIVKGLQCNVC